MDSAIPGDVSKQNFSVLPRLWYLDAVFVCEDCGENFTWTAAEQKFWFEELHFWIDSQPICCVECRKKRRDRKSLRQELDHCMSQARTTPDRTLKKKALRLLDALSEQGELLPEKLRETRSLLEAQLRNLGEGD